MQYVRPGDRFVDQGLPWSTAGESTSKAGRSSAANDTNDARGRPVGRMGSTGNARARAGAAVSASADTDAEDGAEPYLRVFSGCQSEGILAVKWHETMPPLPGLLVSVAATTVVFSGR